MKVNRWLPGLTACLFFFTVWMMGQEQPAASAGKSAPVRVTGLRTDATAEALGIDNPAPRFSWRLEAERPGVQQAAYRIVVATSPAAAAAGQGADLVWDSRIVRSQNPYAIYGGPPLSSRTRYYWTVRVWITGETASVLSQATWFETAYLRPDEWKGDWISGPKRLERPPTPAESLAHDACCLAYKSTLHDPAPAGSTQIRVASVAALAPGVRLQIGKQTVTVTRVGTAAAATTLQAPAAAGATNIKVQSVAGFEAGRPILIGGHAATISSVGTAVVQRTLATPAAAGATAIQLAGGGGAGRGAPGGIGIQPGDTVLIGGESRIVESVSAPQAGRGGAGGPGGGGGGAGRGGAGQPVTVTIKPALSSSHPQGTSVIGLGSGISFTPALPAALAQGTAVSTPGTGIDFTPPLEAAAAAGTAVARADAPADFCRPKGGRGGSGLCREVRPAPMLRKSFAVEPAAKRGKVVSARIYSTGLAYNNLFLNGKRTSDRYLDPPFTNYYDTVYYRTEDVTGQIRQDQNAPAENVIATLLGAGHFDQESVTVNWAYETAEWRQTPRFRMDLYIRYADGSEQVVRSDGTWRVSTDGPTRYDDYYLGETYDARKEMAGWTQPGFKDASWAQARVVEGPRGQLRAQRGDPTRLIASWPAGKRSSPAPGVHVWDTGRLISGWATVRVHGAPAGTPIQISYSDKLTDANTINAGPGAMQVDYYIAKGTGTAQNPERFTPQFTYKGFRYIMISAPVKPGEGGGGGGFGGGPAVAPEPLPDGVSVDVETIHEVRTDMPATSTFRSSNPLLAEIDHAMRVSLAANFVSGIITDTPQYEKNGWTGDAQLTAPTAALQFDVERQFWKSIQDMEDAQTPAGELTLLAPTARGYGHVGHVFKPANCCGATPIWDAFWFVLPWESYWRYGDLRALEATYPLMTKYLDQWIPQWVDKDGDSFQHTLTSGLGDWAAVTGADAPPGSPTNFRVSPISAPSTTAYYAYLVKIAADTARALGKMNDAYRYDQLFERIKADFNAKWWDEKAGYYRESADQVFHQGMAVLPLAFGLVPEEKRAPLQAKLVEDIMKTRQGHAMVGIASMRWILPVLSQAAEEGIPGAADAAYTIMAQTTYPSYGYWLRGLGWAALGEYWERTSRTRSHHMYGSGVQWLYENLAGFQAMEPGYKRIAFRPTIPSGLDHAEATYESVRGRIAASWSKKGSDLILEVTVPPNSTGVVYVPASDPARVTVREPSHVQFAGREGGRLVYLVDSGTYRFTVPGGAAQAR